MLHKKRENSGFEPIYDTQFSALDPTLLVSSEQIPFLGDFPYLMLGKNIAGKQRNEAGDGERQTEAVFEEDR